MSRVQHARRQGAGGEGKNCTREDKGRRYRARDRRGDSGGGREGGRRKEEEEEEEEEEGRREGGKREKKGRGRRGVRPDSNKIQFWPKLKFLDGFLVGCV